MNELKDMLSKSRRFLRTAELLLTEGDYDSCASRSYYAMFFAAEALLLTKEVFPSSHRGLIALFGEHFVKSGLVDEELGRALRRAFELRQKGDYATETLITEEEAEAVLEKAEKFVEEAEKYLKAKDYLAGKNDRTHEGEPKR